MPRRLVPITLAVLLAAACVDPRSTLPLVFEELSNDVVTTLGTDSVDVLVFGSDIRVAGVFYGEATCDGLTWDGTGGVGGRNFLRVFLLPEATSGCPRGPRRIQYQLTISSLEPQLYTLEIVHDRRSVYAQQLDLRGPQVRART